MKKNFPVLILCFLMLITSVSAQKTTEKKKLNYAKHPYWMTMMEDPNVNYFEAVEAYEVFWSKHSKPLDEEQMIGEQGALERESDNSSFFKRIRDKRKLRREEAMREKYGFACKKFEHWQMKTLPYVQPDGSILSAEQQLEIWKKQRVQ